MPRYSIYQGQFVCSVCKRVTTSLRFYPESKEMTWVCKDKHLNLVSLNTKKSKKDYERKV